MSRTIEQQHPTRLARLHGAWRYLPLVQIVAFVHLAAIDLVARPARAEASSQAPFELSYQAPAGCPGEPAMRSDIASHVPLQTRGAGVRLSLTIEEHERNYVGTAVALD